MDFFQLQLGQNIEGETLYIAVNLETVLLIGEVYQFQVLYNSGAKSNLI